MTDTTDCIQCNKWIGKNVIALNRVTKANIVDILLYWNGGLYSENLKFNNTVLIHMRIQVKII